MTSSQTTSSTATGTIRDFRKRWMQWALALSLALHCGAALVVIIASGFNTGGKVAPIFIIEDIALSPSITAPTQSIPPPLSDTSPARISPPPDRALETERLPDEPTAAQPTNQSGSSEKEGGMMSTPLGLGMTHGYFSSLADGRTLRDDIRSYYFKIVERINKEWWDKAGLLKEPLRRDGVFEVLVQRDGAIISIHMVQGTGSREADRLLNEIIRSTSPLSPLPSTYELSQFRAPLRIKMPSFLFRFK